MTLKTKNILAYLAIEEKGDWNRIYERLRSDEVINTLCEFCLCINKSL